MEGSIDLGACSSRHAFPVGLEPAAISSRFTGLREVSGALTGAVEPNVDLDRFVAQWSTAPDHIKAAIQALLDTATR